MKTLVFLLALANLLFYAFAAGYFGRPDNPDAGRVGQQILPERMRIVSRGETPAKAAEPRRESVPGPVAADIPKPEIAELEAARQAAAAPPVCLAWEHLAVADADRLAAALAGQFAEFKVSRRLVPTEGNGWWVHIPPLASKADADRKAGELKQLDISDFFIVQEGPSRFAISLGVFSSEKGGQDRLAELKAKGVRSARLGPRPGKDSTIRLQASGPAAARENVLAAVGKVLPKAEAVDCQ